MQDRIYLRFSLALLLMFCIFKMHSPVYAQPSQDIEGHWAENHINIVISKGWMEGYSDGNFGVNQPMTRAEMAVVIDRILDLPEGTRTFSDVYSHHWAYHSVSAVADAEMMEGDTNHFYPDQYISREEGAAVIVRSFELIAAQGNHPFTDVETDRWSYEYIQTLVANNIMNGYPDDTFRPNQTISRAELAVILTRIDDLQLEPVEGKRGQGEFTASLDFGEDNTVTLHDGTEKLVGEHYIPIFIDGRLVEYAGIDHNENFLIQAETLNSLFEDGQHQKANWQYVNDDEILLVIDGNNITIPIQNLNDSAYIDIEMITPYLDWNVYVHDHNIENLEYPSLIRGHHNIYFDRPITEDTVGTAEEGLQAVQKLLSVALEHYTESLTDNLAEYGEDPTRFDTELELIAEDISNLNYLGEVSKYYAYDMDVYRVYVDRTNGDVYLNYQMGRATYMKLVNIHDPHIFTPLYLVG